MPTADEFSLQCSEVKQSLWEHTSTSAAVHSSEENEILKFNMHSLHFSGKQRGRRVQKVFISAAPQTGSNIYREQSEPKRTDENKTQICLLSVFYSQTYLLISRPDSPLSASHCRLKTSAVNFAQTTLQWWPQISAGRQKREELLRTFVSFCQSSLSFNNSLADLYIG